MRSILIGLAALVIMASAQALAAPEPPAEGDWSGVAKALYDTREFDESVTAYNEALKERPTDAWLIAGRGLALLMLGRTEQARRDIDRAIYLDPNNARAYYGRGRVRLFGRDYDGALADFNMAASLASRYADAHTGLGDAYAGLGDLRTALKSYTRAISLDPDNAEAYGRRGILLVRMEKFSLATRDLTRAISLRPDYIDALNTRGYVRLIKLGDAERGCEDFSSSCAFGSCGYIRQAMSRGLCR